MANPNPKKDDLNLDGALVTLGGDNYLVDDKTVLAGDGADDNGAGADTGNGNGDRSYSGANADEVLDLAKRQFVQGEMSTVLSDLWREHPELAPDDAIKAVKDFKSTIKVAVPEAPSISPQNLALNLLRRKTG